jgi:hypothetical protein
VIPFFSRHNKRAMVLMKYKKRIIASVAFFYCLFWVFYPALCSGEVLIFAAEKQSSGSHQSHEKTGTAAVLPDGARISEKIYGLEGLSNVGRVSRGIYRGAQPLPEGYVTLKKWGSKPSSIYVLSTVKRKKLKWPGCDQ